jgi:exosortase B
MSAVLDARPDRGATWILWLPVIGGLLALYVPTLNRLYGGIWNQEAYAHGPIVLVITLWLLWRAGWVATPNVERLASRLGWCLFAGGLVAYALGRLASIVLLEAGSIVPIAGGLIMALQGWAGLRRYWFPLLFLVFFVPLPPFVVDGITGALKPAVSAVAEAILWYAGYPVARTGVVLTIGQYQLLVADACSGLNSMFALSAMGLLYLYVARHTNRARIAFMLASILPIAFVANIVRVVALMLITYHAGDEAGQGFLHNFSGLAVFLVALGAFLALDALLGRLSWFYDAPRRQ